MNMNNINEQTIFEVCVSCNIVTEVLVTEPVTLRNHYVDGAGQLCQECHTNIYS